MRPRVAAWDAHAVEDRLLDALGRIDAVEKAAFVLSTRLDQLEEPVRQAASDAFDLAAAFDALGVDETVYEELQDRSGVREVLDGVLRLAGQLCAVIGVPTEALIPDRPTPAGEQ